VTICTFQETLLHTLSPTFFTPSSSFYFLLSLLVFLSSFSFTLPARTTYRAFSSYASYWLLPPSFPAFSFSRPCLGQFPPMHCICSHYNPSYPYPPYTLPTFHSPCTSTLKMEAAWSCKILVSNHHTTWHNTRQRSYYSPNRFLCLKILKPAMIKFSVIKI